jgi:cell division protein FtsW (lipid II flippase)
MEKPISVLHWTPRILCILAILFISMFALDAFTPELTIWQQLGAFFIHLIPSFILLALLIVAWKWEYIGGIIFLVIGLGFSPLIFIHNYNMNHSIWMSLGIIMMITFPFFVVGILFLASYYKKKKNLRTAHHV